MPTYDTTIATAPVYQPEGLQEGVLRRVITMATGDLDTNDTFDIGYVPKGAIVTDVILICTDMDNGGSSLTLSVGDAGSAARFISAGAGTTATTLRAGNNATSSATWAAHTAYTSKTLIYGTVAAGAGTAAAGTIVALVKYIVP